GLVAGIALGVARTEFRDLALVERGVRPEEEKATVGKRSERRGVALEHGEAVIVQTQVVDNLLAKQAVYVGRGGNLEARKGLLGATGPAGEMAPLQDKHLPARTCEVAGCDQAIVPRSDDNCVVRCGHALGSVPGRASRDG